MKKIILNITIIIALIIGGFYIYQSVQKSQQASNIPLQHQDERIIDIQLKIVTSLSTETLFVNDQGLISYDAETPRTDKSRQTASARLSDQAFTELSQMIIRNNFWSHNEKYIQDQLFDAPTYTLSIKSISENQSELADAQIRSVVCYGECPDEIDEIIENVKGLWNEGTLEIEM